MVGRENRRRELRGFFFSLLRSKWPLFFPYETQKRPDPLKFGHVTQWRVRPAPNYGPILTFIKLNIIIILKLMEPLSAKDSGSSSVAHALRFRAKRLVWVIACKRMPLRRRVVLYVSRITRRQIWLGFCRIVTICSTTSALTLGSWFILRVPYAVRLHCRLRRWHLSPTLLPVDRCLTSCLFFIYITFQLLLTFLEYTITFKL